MSFGAETLQKTSVSHERSFKNHTSRHFKEQVRKSIRDDSKKEPRWMPKTIEQVIKKKVGGKILLQNRCQKLSEMNCTKKAQHRPKIGRRLAQDDLKSAQDGRKDQSWTDLGVHFGASWPPKLIQKSIIFRTTFLDGFGTPFWVLFGVVLTTFSHLFSDKARCVIFEGPLMRNHAFSKNLASQNRSKINQKRNRKRDRN